MRQTGAGGDTWFWRLFGRGLVIAQVALSIFLVTGTVVFLSHFAKMRNFDLGFRNDHVLLVTIEHSGSTYNDQQIFDKFPELKDANSVRLSRASYERPTTRTVKLPGRIFRCGF